MQANRSKNTGPELRVRAALREAGLTGYRLHWKKAPGRPDVCFPGRRVAIQINGCFWHRCPFCGPSRPKTHPEFWEQKFARNRERDARNARLLLEDGWTLLVVWELLVDLGVVPNFLLPTPVQVVAALVEDAPLIAGHCVVTLGEAAAGLALGVALGFVFAVLMDRFETFYLAFEPLMTVSQTIPTVAIAPLLVLWLGYGALPKIVLVVLSTFFPITVSLVSGFRSVDPDAIDLMRTMNASRWQIFWYAKLPAAADQFFSGLRISATYAIVGGRLHDARAQVLLLRSALCVDHRHHGPVAGTHEARGARPARLHALEEGRRELP